MIRHELRLVPDIRDGEEIEARPHQRLYVLQGGGETTARSPVSVAVLEGGDLHFTYTPGPQTLRNALWPLTPEAFYHQIDDVTEEKELLAAGVEDSIATIEQFYSEGEA
jgi:hypothetical protein